jgi:hypothetical protein
LVIVRDLSLASGFQQQADQGIGWRNRLTVQRVDDLVYGRQRHWRPGEHASEFPVSDALRLSQPAEHMCPPFGHDFSEFTRHPDGGIPTQVVQYLADCHDQPWAALIQPEQAIVRRGSELFNDSETSTVEQVVEPLAFRSCLERLSQEP